MRLSSILIFATTFASAAGLSLIVAGFAATALEQGSEIAVRRALDTNGFSWTEVAADGLQVELSGQAPDEADRFAAISLVGGVVDAARVIDKMEVKPSDGIAPPRFSTEILRNDAGISIIGLIPESSNHTRILNSLQDLNEELPVTDFLETAAHRAPDDWNAALTFGLEALALLPRSKISVQAGMVEIIAISDSPEAKAVLEQQLSRMLPANVKGQIEIAAPRPVISPFILRYVLDENGGRFDACSAESAQARVTILRAAQEAGLRATAECLIGLGVPSVNWAQAAIQAIHSLSMIGQGSVTLSNTDVTLVAAMGTEEALFERVAGELEQALPSVFALHAVLPKPEEDKNSDAQEFTATLSPEGQVQMRGRLADDLQGQTAQSYARARFGSQNVHLATRNVDDLPEDWALRVLAGLEALSHLQRGIVTVGADTIALRGMSYDEDASAQVSRMLSDKLGEAENYQLNITYEAPPASPEQLMAPALCEAELAAVQRVEKIAFEPGSATVADGSQRVLDKIAAVLEQCGELPLEIQGHTDSQGRETMNLNLSQARAQSVLNALAARRLLTGTFSAKGYGEAEPIADNGSEEGREANRRIEFRLFKEKSTSAEAQEGNAGE